MATARRDLCAGFAVRRIPIATNGGRLQSHPDPWHAAELSSKDSETRVASEEDRSPAIHSSCQLLHPPLSGLRARR